MKEAFDLMRTLVRGMNVETVLADELAEIAYDLECQGLTAEAGGLRAIVRHHRSKVVQMRGLLAGVEACYGTAEQSED